LQSRLKGLKLLDTLLIALATLGTILRIIYPFYNNPMSHLWSDPDRHYGNAIGTSDRAYRYLDPLGYQWWLGTYLKLFGNSYYSVAIYTALLSAGTPFIWYLWFRQCLPTKRLALAGLAILTLLPSWLGIYAYFMTETLLLPSLGLALWLTWRSKNNPCLQNIFYCSVAWAFATATKLNVAPEAVICLSWLFWQLRKCHNKRFFFLALSLVLSVIGTVHILGAVDTYQGLGTSWLFPPRFGYAVQAYHRSGAKAFTLTLKSKTHGTYQAGWFQSPAALKTPLLTPLSDWASHRLGTYNVVIDCDQPPRLFAPALPISTYNRLRFIQENIVNFLFDWSWPDCDSNDIVQLLQIKMRWVWSILLFCILLLAIKKKNWRILVLLCLGTALLMFFSEVGVMEGRYRKPWEGVAIAALLSLLSSETTDYRRELDKEV
jgi:hypothetical protein